MAFNGDKTLKVNWSKQERDWMIHSPTSPTGHLTHSLLGGHIDFPEFLKELKERGYDLRTLNITVSKREFKCIRQYVENTHIYKQDNIYFLRNEDDQFITISTHNGYSCKFDKSDKSDNYIGKYFIEVKK